MATLQIQIRLGSKGKTIEVRSQRFSLGRAADCEVALPWDWVSNHHLHIENTDQMLRVRTGDPGAKASMWGTPITMEWSLLASPTRIAIPAPKGFSLILDIAATEPDFKVMILREPVGGARNSAHDSIAATTATLARFDTPANSTPEDPEALAAAGEALGDASEGFTRSQRKVLIEVSVLFLLLIIGALGLNRYRHAAAFSAETARGAEVSGRIAVASELMRKKDYKGAAASLDLAAEVAGRKPVRTESLAEIAAMRARPEIAMGARGLVEMDGQWLAPDRANAWRFVRDRDDPKISEYEQAANLAYTNKVYDDARLACDRALLLISAHPVRPHPRELALKQLAEMAKTEALASEMLAKGYVKYDERWVLPEEKIRLEQKAKGLVEYEGEWMTPAQAQERSKAGGTGKLFFQGRWMTLEEKMAAQGYVQFEGQWMRPEERDALVAKRAQEKKDAEETAKAAENEKSEVQRQEKLKPVAYQKSQAFIRDKLKKSADAKFAEFASARVHVVFDDGWFIVRATIDDKVYFCKLRPAKGDDWEAASTMLAE